MQHFRNGIYDQCIRIYELLLSRAQEVCEECIYLAELAVQVMAMAILWLIFAFVGRRSPGAADKPAGGVCERGQEPGTEGSRDSREGLPR